MALKTNEMLNNELERTIQRFAVKGKYKLIGSNSLRSTLYGSDYDVEDYLKNQCPECIARHFQEAFAEKDPAVMVTDFKCGMDTKYEYTADDYTPAKIKAYLKRVGLPQKERNKIMKARGDEQIELIRDLFILRWTPDDIKKGYKVLRDGSHKSLEECVMDKTTLKIDIIQLIGNQFCEISENYYIVLKNGEKNYDETPSKKKIQKTLEEDIRYYAPINSFKALKRIFSLFLMEGKKKEPEIEKMIAFFNGQVGYLNKIRAELEILGKALQHGAKWEDVEANLQFIKEQLSAVFEIPLQEGIFQQIDKMTASTAEAGIKQLDDYFLKKINEYSKEFLKGYL